MAMMLFRSKREEQADCHYRYSYNRPYRLVISKTRVVSNTDDIGQKWSGQKPDPDDKRENGYGLIVKHIYPYSKFKTLKAYTIKLSEETLRAAVSSHFRAISRAYPNLGL